MPTNQLWRNLTTHTLHFFVDNASLLSGAQFYVVPSLVILLNFIASQLPTVRLTVNATFWSSKTMVLVAYVNLISFRVGFVFSCNYRSKISLVVRMVQSFYQTELWPCTLLEIAHHRLEILIFLLVTFKKSNQLSSVDFNPLQSWYILLLKSGQ